MSNDRTALVIIAALVLAFVIALFERLKDPLPKLGGLAASGQIAGVIYALGLLVLVAGGVAAWRRNAPGDFIRVAAIWIAIFAIVAIIVAAITGGISSPGDGVSL